MTVRKSDNLLRGDRTPGYVNRETGAAELLPMGEGRTPAPTVRSAISSLDTAQVHMRRFEAHDTWGMVAVCDLAPITLALRGRILLAASWLYLDHLTL